MMTSNLIFKTFDAKFCVMLVVQHFLQSSFKKAKYYKNSQYLFVLDPQLITKAIKNTCNINVLSILQVVINPRKKNTCVETRKLIDQYCSADIRQKNI